MEALTIRQLLSIQWVAHAIAKLALHFVSAGNGIYSFMLAFVYIYTDICVNVCVH